MTIIMLFMTMIMTTVLTCMIVDSDRVLPQLQTVPVNVQSSPFVQGYWLRNKKTFNIS